jgi:amino acid adenylation domain-containing protein
MPEEVPGSSAELAAAERELLDLLLEEEGIGPAAAAGIQNRGDSHPGALPLSFAQQRLWFLDRLQPGSPVYNVSSGVRLGGQLDYRALARTLDAVVRRHEVLRTSFPVVEGEPAQRIAPALHVPMPLVDLGGLAGAEPAASRLAALFAQRPFDLESGPLIRGALLRLAATDHVALLVVHHIVSDGWSAEIMTREIGALYQAFAAGRPSPLPELPIQYADFSLWQRGWLTGEVLAEQLAFWRRQLQGIPPLLELPTDRPRPAVQTHRGGELAGRVPAATATALNALSERRQASLFMTALAGFQALLHRYTGQSTIAVGTPIANRHRRETEALIGFFVNTLVMRVDLGDDPDFLTLLERVKEAALEAYAHQDLPFERLVDELQPDRNLSHSPIFQVSFVFQNVPRAAQELAAATRVARFDFEQTSARFDLSLALEDRGVDLIPSLEFNTDLFDPTTARRLLTHYRLLLAGVARDPSRRISEIPLLTLAERWQAVAEWNDTRARFRQPGEMVGWLQRPVEEVPEATAVAFEDQLLSYRAFAARADRLAHRLRRAGVGPEVVVGLCLERSVGMVVAILGTLKAGGAYLPLEPTDPRERLELLLADAAPGVLVRQPGVGEDLAPPGVAEVVLGPAADDPSATAGGVVSGVAPHNLAYCIYTSGSTGRPKGALLSHRGVCNRLLWMQDRYGLDAGDRVLQKTPFTFDVSVWEFLWPLMVGARLVVARPLGHRDAAYLAAVIARYRITVLHFVPSMLQTFLDAGGVGSGAALRLVVASGEALPAEIWQRFRRRSPARLDNLYGPTEASVDVSWWRCRPLQREGIVPIGRPIANLRLLVLDRRLRPVPLAVSGELCIAGVGLGRGYLRRPALTADRFVPAPDPQERGERLYRTGDLARHRGDGRIEFLGRIDHQVKVRGFRIELGEVEAVLGRHPAVREAVVVARGDGAERRLVAYLTGDEQPVEAMRRSLERELPEHMIPPQFVWLAALPLTTSGKVDRRRLPQPEGHRPELEQAYRAPGDEVEEILAGIWEQVLGLDRVGIDDNYFALGGDSIRSIRVLSLAAQRNVRFTLQDLFQHQTIASLARQAREAVAAPPRPRVPPFGLLSEDDRRRLPPGLEDAYPLTLLQAGMLYHMERLPEHPIFHNVNAWRLRGRFEDGPFRRAVAAVVARHSSLRTAFAREGFSEPLQLVHRRAELPVVVTDLTRIAPADRDALVEQAGLAHERWRFPLSEPPLTRFHLQLLDGETFHFTLAENHAISDGWSLHSTLGEIFDRYLSLLAGETRPEPPPLASSFRDYVALERQALRSEESRQFWRQQLRDCTVTEVPRWPRGEGPRPERRILALDEQVPAEVAAGLERLARGAAVPIKSVLLAVHLRVLAFLSGEVDVLTGMVSNGRLEELDGEQVRGLFLNAPPLRLRLPAGATWRQLARQVFQLEQELLPHRRYPLTVLEQQWGRRRLVETDFNYIHFHVVESVIASGGIEVLDSAGQVEQIDLPLSCNFSRSPVTGGLSLTLEYETAEFPAAQVRAILGYYRRALAAAAAAPDGRHEAVGLLSPAELHLLARERNDTRTGALPRRSIVEAVVEKATRVPEATALACGDEHLSYRELGGRSGRLANLLVGRGLGPERLAGLALERSPDLVVAQLAILRTGAGYLPLDPDYPRQRLTWMMEDARPEVLVTRRELRDRLPGGAPGEVLVGRDRGRIARQPATPPASRELLDAVAYVTFTSGSTGRPKGVMMSRRTVGNRLAWLQRVYRLDGGDRVAQNASFSFDDSVMETLWPLSVGATTVLSQPGGQRDPAYLARFLAERRITLVALVPSMIAVLLEQEGLEGLGCLRAVLGGGESLAVDVHDRFLDRVPAPLINLWGATEACIEASRWVCRREPGQRTVPIGAPNGDTAFYALGPGLTPVPLGTAGELFVGGPSLARGYVGRPALSAERLLPDPFAGEPGARMYRTGDRVRCRFDGAFEFVGRVDLQVQIRGFRVEPEEIEAVLRTHPLVSDAVVTVVEAGAERSLAAYLVPAPGAAPEPASLRDHLRLHVPDHMVPASYTVLVEVPRTPSGKVDRRRLPAPEVAEADAAGFAALRSGVEEVLAAIWRELLDRTRVGAHDDFFELGGHSLLATRLVSRLRGIFGVELPLRTVFERPALADLAAAVEEALARGSRPQAPPLERVPRERPLPLSFAQQRLWFLHLLAPESPAYNLFDSVEFRGPLALGSLAASFREIVRRHEVLRTRFQAVGGEPLQVAVPAAPLPLPVVDLSGLGEAAGLPLARDLGGREVLRPFDLAAGPLLRVRVLRLAPERHAVILTQHHVVSDGWSQGILARELSALYRAFSAGRQPSLPELPIQYADFAAWQRGWLVGEALERQLSYWRRQLAGPLPALDLPTDRPRPAELSSAGRRVARQVPRELTEALRALSNQHGATLFMTVLAAFQCLLGRLTAQRDVLVGSPVAGRNRAEIEPLIGFFVNTLVLRTDLSGEPSFGELIQRVRATALAAFAHQDLPFERLVEDLQPTRDLSRSPLFQVSFVFAAGAAPGRPDLPGLTLRPFPLLDNASMFDLTLFVEEGPEGLSLVASFRRQLFDATTVQRLLSSLESLFAEVASRPERRVGDLPVLTAAERQALLVESNDTRREAPPRLIREALGEQAGRTPDSVALVAGEEAVSYAGLERRAAALAEDLGALGVGPGRLVGVACDRSLEAVTAIVAVLRAGGAYLPLEPSYPLSRLRFMAEEAEIDVLLGRGRQLAALAALAHHCIDLDQRRPPPARSSAGGPLPGLQPEDLAYLLYTSGSTGRPKGVLVTQGGLANYVAWAVSAYRMDECRDVPLHSPLGFDLTVTSLFGPLSAGGCVRVVQQAEGGQGLAETLASGRPRVLVKLTPSHLQLLDRLLPEDAEVAVATFVIGGEALAAETVSRWRRRAPAVRMFNEYGPTEAVVGCCVHAASAAEEAAAVVPIGRPIANARLYVADRRLRAVARGVAGELLIAGVGLARGYLKRPGRTAQSFLPDPWATAAGGRLYRSGDLVRQRADGNLEYLGRRDDQIKIRGYRIEPGEVEAVLKEHPLVQEAVVGTVQQAELGSVLVAWIVPRGEEEPVADELRERLERSLPAVMVPARMVMVTDPPLTEHGKLDRRRLAALATAGSAAPLAAITPPRNILEAHLARIWEDVLGLSGIGMRQDFFALGGHSLVAVRVLARIRDEMGYDLPLSVFFRAPTVEALAGVIRYRSGFLDSPLVPIQARGERPPLFCVHPAGGGVICYLPLAQRLGGGQPVYGLEARPRQERLTTLEELGEHYLAAVREVQRRGPYCLLGWSFGGLVAFEMARQLRGSGEEVALLALVDTNAPGFKAEGEEEEEPLDLENAEGLTRALEQTTGRELPIDFARLPEQGDRRRQLEFILGEAKRLSIVPVEVGLDEVLLQIRNYNDRLLAARAYAPGPYDGPGTLFLARQEAAAPAPAEAADEEPGADPGSGPTDLGWRAFAPRLAVVELSGDHHSIVREPVALAKELEAHLGRLAGAAAGRHSRVGERRSADRVEMNPA